MRTLHTLALTIALACAGGCTKNASQGSGSSTGGGTAAAPKAGGDGEGGKVVELDTTMGKIEIELNPEKAPKTVANFLQYVRAGFYNGTIFHRVISSFMIQGGGFGTDMQKKSTRAQIQNEADNGLTNDRGTIAMARTPNPHSASAQFFINVKDNTSLNHTNKTQSGWGYCVFGKVTKGMDVVDKIKDTPTANKGGAFANAPVTPVVINAAKVVR